ncbi:TetR family transcriptional regulator [Streptomyces sp. IB2014 016-6]|uniref:TetR/AcrR family transcriptional regulator n=1 Tax=Streptomyces sp. IB2014 016-6 TaxID=2517818 RepID=UPI0011C705E5|nr:TetR family transcriptional regulator [Streptomyces sp. IB2014 016-6]TXL85525.1 TetR/AcrR family transcriptional regulator [Streptomyces sp. IB2014 016-6]
MTTGHAADETTAPGADAGVGPETDPGAETDPGTDAGAESGADPGTGRLAILRAARRAFTQRPYAEVTMRGIAADAGVSASLIVKRFGTKERLFNTVADFGPAADRLFAAPPAVLGRHLVVTMVRLRRENHSDPLLRVVFSLGNMDERTLLRERFREQVTARLAGLIGGERSELRAELITGQLLGLGATLSLHRPGAGEEATPELLADLYAPALQRLITGQPDHLDQGPGRAGR